VLHAIAAYHLNQGDLPNAERQLTKILEKRPNDFPARMLKGELLFKQHDYQAALQIFDQLIAEEPKSAQVYYLKGVSHLNLGDSGLAKMAITRSVELAPGSIRAKLLLAEIYLRERDFALAQKEADKILASQPDNFQARLILGNAYLYQNKFPETQDAFQTLIDLAPDNPIGYFRMGLLQRALKQNDAALNNFEKALSIKPDLMDVFTNVVMVLAAKKDYAAALKRCDDQLQRVGESAALSAAVHNLKGSLYLAQGQKTSAEESFQTAIKENPDYLMPYYQLARMYLADNQQEKAIGQYQSILEVNPQQAQPHMLMGIIYDTQNQHDLSEKHYRTALEINPEFAPAANNLAFILAERNENLDEALRLAQLAKKKIPESPYVMDTLGWVYYKKGLYDSAIGEFTDSLEKIPDNPAVIYHLGMAYHKKGDNQKARAELEKALGLDENFMGADEARKVLAELS
jgi:tetratricopeptide (TPR) repeat protein